MEARRRILGEDHPDIANSMADLAMVYLGQGRYDEAEPLCLGSLETRRRILGEDHPDTLYSLVGLAIIYAAQGRDEEAEQVSLEALGIARRTLGHEHVRTLQLTNNLAMLYGDQGRFEEAEALQREVVEKWRRVLGEDHPETLIAESNLGSLYMAQGRLDMAEPMLAVAVAKARRSMPKHRYLGRFLSRYGRCLTAFERFEEAERDLLEGHAILEVFYDPTYRHTVDAVKWLADLYDAWGKPVKAAEWRAKLPTEKDAVASDPPAVNEQDVGPSGD